MTGGPFSAQIERFWKLVQAGGRAFTDLLISAGGYINFGTVLGSSGYGIRDNGGSIEAKDSGGSWVDIVPSGGSAPADATYIVQTPSAGLSAEQALSALSSGLAAVTTTTGVVSTVANVAAGSPLVSAGTGNTPPAYYTAAAFSTPSGASQTSNFASITGTLPAVTSAITTGVNFRITSAGSSASNQEACRSALLGGYTGAGNTNGFTVTNSVAGTATTTLASGGGNRGTGATVNGVTAGNNAGVSGFAQGSSSLNAGCVGLATSGTNSATLNMGLAGIATSATVNVGGFFGLAISPAFASSAALIADNGAIAADIQQWRDNGTRVSWVADGGGINAPTFTPTTQQTYAISNVTTDRSYDANATTLDEVADTLGTLIADLRAIGLVL